MVIQGQGPVGGINAVDEGIKEEPASEEEVLSFLFCICLLLTHGHLVGFAIIVIFHKSSR